MEDHSHAIARIFPRFLHCQVDISSKKCIQIHYKVTRQPGIVIEVVVVLVSVY